jgi:hypothetical protein
MFGKAQMFNWNRMPIDPYEEKVIAQIDGHFCYDWDGLAVSAHTMEYDSCVCFPKSRLGRLINRFAVLRFNFGWWRVVGLPDLFRKLTLQSDERVASFPVGDFFGGPSNFAPEDVSASIVGQKSTEDPFEDSDAVL